MKLKKMVIDCDLSVCALEDAALHLPPTKLYRLQVHPDLLPIARLLVGYQHPSDVQPLAPLITVEVAAFEKHGHWALWSGDHCIWSPGA